jgi:DNA-binding MarR family transcriptional regulator
MKNHTKALAGQILRFSNKLIFLEKKSIIEHGDLKLYPSEIHLMNIIDTEKDMNASEMANKLGVTKGAVSQTLSRLDEKGIISKTKDTLNKNRLEVRFTSLGKEIFKKHLKIRASIQEKFAEYLDTLSDKERNIISNFLTNMDGFFKHVS